MNVIIGNKYVTSLQNLGIDVMSCDNGVFTVDEIIDKYRNFFYQRMILDITALKDYQDIRNLQKLSISLDMDKLILLLEDDETNLNQSYLSQLISIGIYNFTKNIEGVMYLFNNPNTYRDVAQYHLLNSAPTAPTYVQNGQGNQQNTYVAPEASYIRILGVKNITRQAGATSLAYMMYNLLKKNYKVIAIEVDKSDFVYYNNNDLISTTSANLTDVLNHHNNEEVIIIDINDSSMALSSVQEVLYLVEPSILKLNKLLMINPAALTNLKDKKIVLNQSFLSNKDVLDFEYEAKIKAFGNLPSLDDRDEVLTPLVQLLVKLGYSRLNQDTSLKKGIF